MTANKPQSRKKPVTAIRLSDRDREDIQRIIQSKRAETVSDAIRIAVRYYAERFAA